MSRKLGGDGMAGLAIVALSGATAWLAMNFPDTQGAVPGPAVFPLLLAAID